MKAGLSLAIFAFAYVLISVRRVPFLPDRARVRRAARRGAAGAARLPHARRRPTPSVDGDTIAILFGMMVLQVELDRSGLLDAATAAIARRRR